GGFGPLTLVPGAPRPTDSARGAPAASDRKDAVCAVCGEPNGPRVRILGITRGGVPALDICRSCLAVAGEIIDRVRPLPVRLDARCTVCGARPSTGNPVVSLPGRGAADLCRECSTRFRHLFAADRRPRADGQARHALHHLLFPDFPPLGPRPAIPSGRPDFPPPRRFPPMGHCTPTGGPAEEGRASGAKGAQDPQAAAPADPPRGPAPLPPFEKAMLKRHSNWRITTVGRGLDFVRRLGGAGKPCSFCGRRPGEGKEAVVLGHDRADVRICLDCVKLYADAVRGSATRPEVPKGARCALCRLPVRPGLAMMTGIFPSRLMLCEVCIEALDSMAGRLAGGAGQGPPAPGTAPAPVEASDPPPRAAASAPSALPGKGPQRLSLNLVAGIAGGLNPTGAPDGATKTETAHATESPAPPEAAPKAPAGADAPNTASPKAPPNAASETISVPDAPEAPAKAIFRPEALKAASDASSKSVAQEVQAKATSRRDAKTAPSKAISRPEAPKAAPKAPSKPDAPKAASKPDTTKVPAKAISEPDAQKVQAKAISRPEAQKAAPKPSSKPDAPKAASKPDTTKAPAKAISRPDAQKAQAKAASKPDAKAAPSGRRAKAASGPLPVASREAPPVAAKERPRLSPETIRPSAGAPPAPPGAAGAPAAGAPPGRRTDPEGGGP
ncbi:MAG: hypothetical protein LBR80_15375, partial [Deltaproteobacteria bacterium]|nr:hypothetical protein [Deltaproteobacteria bacterium]